MHACVHACVYHGEAEGHHLLVVYYPGPGPSVCMVIIIIIKLQLITNDAAFETNFPGL